jgi:DNA repair exonuclease SbcCD nuclease subunit
MTKTLRMPDNVRTLSVDHAETVTYDDIGLAVHGQGFATPAVLDDLSAGYPLPLDGYVNVGLLHTSADGRPGHERYAPSRPDRLAEQGYDYWALGHVHQREILVADPPVVFSGCLQGRHAREAGPRGATMVHVAADGKVSLEEHVLDHVRWVVCEVDASDADDDNDVYGLVSNELRRVASACGDRLVAARVQLRGASHAHATLVRDHERVHYEVAAAASEAVQGDVWVERIVVRTSPISALSTEGDDAYAEVVRTIGAAASRDAALSGLAEELRPLAAKLPGALLSQFDPTDAQTIRELLDEVARTLPTRLLEDAG